jgi:hypothetical protein
VRKIICTDHFLYFKMEIILLSPGEERCMDYEITYHAKCKLRVRKLEKLLAS